MEIDTHERIGKSDIDAKDVDREGKEHTAMFLLVIGRGVFCFYMNMDTQGIKEASEQVGRKYLRILYSMHEIPRLV